MWWGEVGRQRVFNMYEVALNDRLFLAFAAALGLIVAGAGNALFGPKAWWVRSAIAAVGCAVAVGAAFALIPEATEMLAAAGAALLAAVSLAHVGSIRRGIAAVWNRLQKPRIAWTAVALVGFGTMAHETIRHEILQDEAVAAGEASLRQLSETSPYVADESRLAKTDHGSGIHLMTVAESTSAEDLSATEQQTILASQLADYIIRRGPADDSSNCHGWVFAGGKFAILGGEVDTILTENEYATVAGPRPGDLSVYRTDAGGVAHTAIVRSVLEDGTVLVEGKWGRLGVFLHPIDRSPYGSQITFHHTDRGTHVLRSIPGSSN